MMPGSIEETNESDKRGKDLLVLPVSRKFIVFLRLSGRA
jgi:hypothetical protein